MRSSSLITLVIPLVWVSSAVVTDFIENTDTDAVTVVQTQLATEPAQVPDGFEARLALSATSVDNNVLVEAAPIERPHLDEATVVEFGLLWKHFYGIDTIKETFEVDVILQTSWDDPRVKKLIPEGRTSIRYSDEAAASSIWKPKVKVTNLQKDGIEIISTSYLLEAGLIERAGGTEETSGKVTKTERALATLKGAFEFDRFPFDSQDLEIAVASETYMSKEVVLMPSTDTELWGAPSKLLREPWYFGNASLYSFADVDGAFSKSRGVLHIRVRRSAGSYISTVFVPSCMLFIMGQTSFWLPLAPPFVMPRIALNAIALLSQVTLALRVTSLTPCGVATLMDDYIEGSFLLQFISLILNGAILALHHKFGDEDAAALLNKELIMIIPCAWVVTMTIICVASTFHSQPSTFTRGLMICFGAFYYVTRIRPKILEEEESKP